MSGSGESSVGKIVTEAVEEAKKAGTYKEPVGPQIKPFPEVANPIRTAGQGDHEWLKPVTIKDKFPEVINDPEAPPSFQGEEVAPAERFRNIAEHASDPRPQGV